MNLNLNDVLDCRRVLEHKGCIIEYTTGLNNVYLNVQDVLYTMHNAHMNVFRYCSTMEDLVHLMRRHKVISKSLLSLDESVLSNYLFYNPVDIDIFINLCDKAGSKEFSSFLRSAKETILKYGLYVPKPQMEVYDKRNNQDRNISSVLQMRAISKGAERMNVYEDQLYLDIANIVSNIVFNCDIESLRYRYNLLYEDYVSDFISDYEYDLVAYCCKVINYLLEYSDIGLYGIEFFTREALNVAMTEFSGDKSRSKGRTRGEKDTLDKIFNNDLNDESNKSMKIRKKVTDKEADEFRRYM